MSTPLTEIERINALLPTELFAGSKDWRVGSIADRVDWLLTMYSSAKEEVERLQSALEAQPQQEPVAWMSNHAVGFRKSEFGATPTVPLYTSPPAQRKPLTDEELDAMFSKTLKGKKLVNWVARAIEAAHGIKGDA